MLLFAFYVLKVIICSGVLFGYYWLLLRNKIFHQYNRFYLLATIVLSLLAPLVQINIWRHAAAPATTIKLLQVVNSSNEYLDEIVLTARRDNFTAEQFASLLYSLVCCAFFILFIQVLLKIRTLLKHHRQTIVDNIHFVNTTAKGTPFSFLQYIFWNDHIDITTTTGNQIFKHELAHVQQKHSYDKLFINAVLIFFWCNPFFWLIRKELNMIHEFMADKIAVEDSDTEAFAAMILQATYPQHRFPLTNPFFYSPIKRRLLMLTKNKNPKAGYIGRVLVLPVATLLLAAFTLKTKTIPSVPVYNGKKITVVLDAGHGGKDVGAISTDGRVTEKDMNLSIVQKIKALNNNPNIQLILSRDADIFQSPREKADFSLAQHPDLFISIHINATEKDSAALKTGMEVYVAKDNFTNTGNSKLFASAIINEFAGNYKIPVAQFPMQRETGIWVLQQSACPAVLIGAGYITNKKDLAYIQTDEAKETIAKNVLAAIEKYALQKDGAIMINKGTTDTVPQANGLPENMLYIVNGKILGRGKKFIENEFKKYDEQNKSGKAHIMEMKLITLKEKDAISKYGEQGRHGAIEVSISISRKPSTPETDYAPIFADLKDNKVFTQVENEPKFPGGDSAWKHYLQKNLNPATPVDSGAPAGTYRVIIKFIVTKDGSIADAKALTKYGYGMEKAALELIKKGPKWEPAIQNNHIVTAYKKQPITFVIQEQ